MKKVIAKGVDLSYCQQNVDFEKLKKGGNSFVMLKLGNARDSGLTIDVEFENHYNGATAAGLDIGVYVYSLVTTTTAADECATQAVATLKDKVITYPVMFDVEFEDYNLKCGRDHNTALVMAFCRKIEQLGYYAGVYTCPGFVGGYINDGELQRFDHWIADVSPNKLLDYDGPCGLWQYNVAGDSELDIHGIGAVPGVEGKCDMDYAYYDYPTRIRNLGCNNLSKAAEPQIKPDNSAIKVGDTVKVKGGATSYNGGGLATYVYTQVYEVMQVGTADKDDYIVIGRGGQVTAAVKIGDLVRV